MSQPAPTAWRCGVCGYIHREGQAPEWCPVCGSAQSDFEHYVEAAPAPKAAVSQWRCLNCGYLHAGAEAPELCPACLHPRAHFELLGENW